MKAPAENRPDRHVIDGGETASPAPFRGPLSELHRWFCYLFLKASGWRVRGDWPAPPKAVVIAAPHTSNWDGVYMLAAAGYYRVKLRWMGKKTLVEGPFGFVVKWLGCVPIDRASRHDVVEQMANSFAASRALFLAVPPEGTRARTETWKTGFYHIAHKAGVPIFMSVLDYGAKTIGISGVLTPSGDYEADMPLIRWHYRAAAGKFPERFAMDTAPGADFAELDQS